MVFPDEIDKKILRVLQGNCDLPIQEIGNHVGLSHTPCWRRINRLQEEGFIERRVAILNPEKIDCDISIFVLVRLSVHTPKSLETFENATRKIPEIMQCYTMSGEFDYLLRIVVSTVRDYEKTVKGKLLTLPNVGVMNSHFALNEIKNTTEFPI